MKRSLKNRLDKLEEATDITLEHYPYCNCLTPEQHDRFIELLESDKTEDKEFERLFKLSLINAQREFIEQYDKPIQDFETVLADFKKYQRERERVTAVGNAVTTAKDMSFREFLINNELL